MGVIFETELGPLMARDKSLAALRQDEEEGRTALRAKAADEDVEGFRGPVPIQTACELGRPWCASVLRLQDIVFDRPGNPWRFESFINVAEPQQLACVKGLVTQERLQLHFLIAELHIPAMSSIDSSHGVRLRDRSGASIGIIQSGGRHGQGGTEPAP